DRPAAGASCADGDAGAPRSARALRAATRRRSGGSRGGAGRARRRTVAGAGRRPGSAGAGLGFAHRRGPGPRARTQTPVACPAALPLRRLPVAHAPADDGPASPMSDSHPKTALSVNLNKVALVRNTRHLGIPSATRAATLCLEAGAQGITVH